MLFRVIKAFAFHDQRGLPVNVKPGQIIDVLMRNEANELMAKGVIAHKEDSHNSGYSYGKIAQPYTPKPRIGIWMMTSPCYSGGRVHMYQYAWCLAKLGAEVWIVTNAMPIWRNDYPQLDNLHIVIDGKCEIPKDLDIAVTDSKGGLGEKALGWKRRHPWVPLVCFNFETPNWVEKYVPDYAKRLSQNKDVFENADYLISNSNISSRHLLEWVKKKIPAGVLNPAVNTFALAERPVNIAKPSRPYAIYSARSADYKGGRLAVSSIWSLKVPFDLVVFGTLNHPPKDTSLHKFYLCSHKSDVVKYELMRDARMVLAPSKFEGYGMVPGEALASGTPCVVYDLPVLRDAYGDSLVYVPWGDSDKFKKTVSDIAQREKHKLSINVALVAKEKGMSAMLDHIQTLSFHAVSKPRISCHMICYWGFIPESLEAVYPYVDEIRIAYGPTQISHDVKPDGSLETLKSFPDPDGKISITVRDCWRDKLEMRQFCTSKLRGNYHMLLDADEIWVGMDEWMKAKPNYTSPRWVNFWHDGNHWVYDSAKLAGLRWGRKLDPFGSVCPHYRWSYWRQSYRFRTHPVAVDMNDEPLHVQSQIKSDHVPQAVIYHLGHCLPKSTMRAKHEFYRKRDGDNAGRRQRQQVWEKWNGKLGDCGDGIIANVDWELPDIVKRGIARMQK